MKSQSSMILIIIVLMMFVGIVVFLLSLANTVSREGFTSLYVNNLLLSVMRTDTGYMDSKCKLVSDLVACACYTPDWMCGQMTCQRLANETVTKYMAFFGNQTTSLKYLFVSTSEVVCRDAEGNPMTLEIGDSSLKTSRKESFKIISYPLVITKTFDVNSYTMRMELILAEK